MALDLEGKTVVWVRTDSIGDNVLAIPSLELIKGAGKPSRIVVVCQQHVAELYEACPFVDKIISFKKPDIYVDKTYREWIIRQIQGERPDVALNSVYSREPLTDELTHASGASVTCAIDGDFDNISPDVKRLFDAFYTHLVRMPKVWEPEYVRHVRFLQSILDYPVAESYHPYMYLTDEDEEFAEDVFRHYNINPEKAVAFFPGAQFEYRVHPMLPHILPRKEYTIIGLGAKKDAKYAEPLKGTTNYVDLFGKTTLRQAAAVIKRCRLAVGAETGLTHFACAFNLPCVSVTGGGHFGRFLPYTSRTILVTHAMDCFGCSWRCSRNYECVQKINADALRFAVERYLNGIPRRPVVIYTGDNTRARELLRGLVEWVKYS